MNGNVVIGAVALAACLTACAGATTADPGKSAPRRPTTATPSSAFGDYSSEPTPFEAGTYRVPASAWSVADFTVTFPNGWTQQYGHVYGKHPDTEAEFGFYAVVVHDIFDDPCHGADTRLTVGPSVPDLVTALREQPGPRTSDPVETMLGGYPAVRIDFRVPKGYDLGTCRLAEDGIDGFQVWQSVPADKYFVLGPDAFYSAYLLDVEGQRQVFLASYLSATSSRDRAELQQVLDSIRIEP
jgi:hypothetical protein